MSETAAEGAELVDLGGALSGSQVLDVVEELDRELVGLAPVKTRIREIACLLLIARLREQEGLAVEKPSLHMSFTGSPGTGKTTVALRMAQILQRLGYLRKGHLVVASRDDLVGSFVGHTAPKTKELLKKAAGGVLFIDEAYSLYRPENERDYGAEAIEILLAAMEAQREDLVVVFAGYKDRMQTFFQSNPGLHSRVAHHLDFPDFTGDELLEIAERLLARQMYRFDDGAREVFREYLERRVRQAHFSNARSVRNALDRIKLRQASRLVTAGGTIPRDELMRIDAEDIRKSRVFDTGAEEPADGTAAPLAPREES